MSPSPQANTGTRTLGPKSFPLFLLSCFVLPHRVLAGSPGTISFDAKTVAGDEWTASPDSLRSAPGESLSLIFSTVGSLQEEPSTPLSLTVAAQDSPAVHLPPLHLLPESLSPVEHILWGEHGVLRTTGIAPYTVSARKNELAVRRGMLTVHQIGGFVTLGLLVPTLVYGQRNLQNWNDAVLANKPFNRELNRTHIMWANLTFISYIVTAALAILSPPPLIRRNEGSTITTHKLLAWIHFVGMMAMPILGSLAAHAKTLDQANAMRTVHEIVGYSTAAALATAMIVITF